jgi:protein TonB
MSLTVKRRRLFFIFVLLSVAAHFAAALVVVVLPRLLPDEPQPKELGTVELLMVEKKGAGPDKASQPTGSAPATKQADKAPADKAENAKPEVPQAEPAPSQSKTESEPAAPTQTDASLPPPKPSPSPDQPDQQAEPRTDRAEAVPAAKPAEAQPVPPTSQKAPIMDLGGTDSESNAVALGEQVLPATQDDRFRNRPPVYPVEAEAHGEHGSVVVVIHVSDNGLAAGIDILESSGYEVLDKAVVTAVQKWHFRPALKEGQPVPFDMPFRFVFEP